MAMDALIFDCDGVLVDTEKNGHRVAFNRAFASKGLGIEWDVQLYGSLLKVAGGKERMTHYFDRHGWPAHAADQAVFVQELHELKTHFFMEIIASGQLPLRSGVMRLVDEAIADGTRLAVCSTSNERAVTLIVETLLGHRRRSHFLILAGDVVAKKKPDPEIYSLVRTRLDVPASSCIVIEDSRNGLLAAKAAGIRCVITTNGYTMAEDFTGADAVLPELGDEPNPLATLSFLRGLG